MSPQDYYRQQSPMSDPKGFVHLYDALPDDLGEMCRVVRDIYLHYWAGDAVNYKIPPEQGESIDFRTIECILERVQMLDDRPLPEWRPYDKRYIGCCRDAALLLTSFLRHKGIPARSRVGFAKYIRTNDPTFRVDHVITEYYDGGRWKLVDAEQGEKLIKLNNITFDVQDIPRDEFIVAGLAWQRCRSGQDNAQQYGVQPDENFFRGWWAIRQRLHQDLLSLNKKEYLLWDVWGIGELEFDLNEANQALLDQIAAATQGGDATFEEIQTLLASDPRLYPPRSFMTYSPARPAFETTL